MPAPTHTCEAIEPLLAAVAFGDATTETLARVDEHCAGCAACTSALDDVREMDGVMTMPFVARPSASVRSQVITRVRRDLATAEPGRVIGAVLGGAALAIVALIAADAASPLASGIPLLVCGAAWTATISLGVYLALQKRGRARWPMASLMGVCAALLMSFVCPPPMLVASGRAAGWFSSHTVAAELLVGLGFGIVPIVIALMISRDARASTITTAALGAVLLAAELPLLFAQCCNNPAVSAWPVLSGALAGALLAAFTVLALARFARNRDRSSHV